jgi:hypothetical protein
MENMEESQVCDIISIHSSSSSFVLSDRKQDSYKFYTSVQVVAVMQSRRRRRSSGSSHIRLHQSSSSRRRRRSSSSVEIPPKTRKTTKSQKTKHIMKISHINVNIYDKTAISQQNSD